MDSDLTQKRRELFELHKAKLGTDAPLMRKPVVLAERKMEQPKERVSNKKKLKFAVIGVTGVVVIFELLYLAREAGWLSK